MEKSELILIASVTLAACKVAALNLSNPHHHHPPLPIVLLLMNLPTDLSWSIIQINCVYVIKSRKACQTTGKCIYTAYKTF
jgi:hypothetical protein